MSAWNVAILGATGAVGRVMVEILEASPIEVGTLRLLASPRSAGSTLSFRGQQIEVEAVSPDSFDECQLALFSAGGSTSGEWAPLAVRAGAWVIDNSSRFRMDPEVSLVVPEVNASALPAAPTIVANPNCSTIQLVVALHPIREAFGLERVTVSTYQSVSGAGQKGVAALVGEADHWVAGELQADTVLGSAASAKPRSMARASTFAHPIMGEALPHVDVFLDDGYTREEEKMLRETRKILGAPELVVQPTCVRVPVIVSHSEAVYVETEMDTSAAAIRHCLAEADGIEVIDAPEDAAYPLARDAAGKDPVFVGRIRQDRCHPRGFHLWVVADNLRKGAALNAVQIAEHIWRRDGA